MMKPDGYRRGIRAAVMIFASILCMGWTSTWETVESGFSQVAFIQAGFVQEKHLAILARPLISNGRFWFKAPDSFRWEYVAPIQSLLLMDKGDISRYHFQDGRWVKDTGMSSQALQVMAAEITKWVSGRFRENPDYASTLLPEGRVRMVPNNQSLSGFIASIEVNLAKEPGRIDSVIIHEGPDSYTRFVFEHADTNSPIPQTVFTLD